jgi:hypothetical protein
MTVNRLRNADPIGVANPPATPDAADTPSVAYPRRVKQNAFDSFLAHCDSSVPILNGRVPLEEVVVAERNPVAFMCYLRRVDQHDQGRLTELRKRLEGEVQLYTGEEDFAIFQDREDIRWGQQWRSRIEDSLNDVTFLIPIITRVFPQQRVPSRARPLPSARGKGETF